MKVLLPDPVMPITAILISSVGVDQYRNPDALASIDRRKSWECLP
jgi:hypothetical protein